jgi:DNA-binding NarL/FixJ family response regulator
MRLAQSIPLLSLISESDLGKLHAAAASATTELRVKVFIISDVRLHRDGLMSLLRECSSVEVLGSDNLIDSLSALRTTLTDVVLLDIAQRADSRFVNALRQTQPRLRILALAIRETAGDVLACAAAGVDGYVAIDATVEDMLSAVEAVIRGELFCSPEVAASLYQCIGAPRSTNAAPLTMRELQVADLMDRGLPNKEIARHLGVEPCTAKNHVRNILQKLNVHRRGQAVAKLRGLIGRRWNADPLG